MSNRLLLRAAVVAALKDATIAQGRVFDTLIGPLQESDKDNWLPVICVYTDGDRREQINTGSGPPRFRRMVDIVIELSIGSYNEVEIPGPQGNPEQAQVFSLLQTDPELEAVLDLFELQVFRRVFGPADAAIPLAQLVTDWSDWASIPGRSAEGNNKLSARQMTISVRIPDDCFPVWDNDGPAVVPVDKKKACLWPLLETRAPHLVDLICQIASVPQLASLKDMIEEMTGGALLPQVPTLNTLGFKVDERDPDVDKSLTGGAQYGPDGRIELEAVVDIPPKE